MAKKYLAAILVACAVFCASAADDGLRLLTTWCDGMIAHQLDFPHDSSLDGGMVCPACGFLHGRICDAVYGFVVAWQETGDAKYLKAAERAVNWTEANMLRPGGFYKNDEQSTWWYTTVFSQIAFGKTLREFGDKLPPALKDQWLSIYTRQTAWMYDYFLRPEADPVVNYWGNFAEAMAEAGLFLNEPRYTQAAKDMVAKLSHSAFTPEKLLKGEAHPMFDPTPDRGDYAVDFGYNLEETMPALLAAAEVLGDKDFEKQVIESALVQLEVLLPDGAIDNSMGSRSSKWTYTGSRTSDGVLILLGQLERKGIPWAHRAAEKVIQLHLKMTAADGLLYGGLYYADAKEPPCIHHTFTHVKSIAEWIMLTKNLPKTVDQAYMPREKTPRLVEFPSMSTKLVGLGPWRATFSANDSYVSKGRGRWYSMGGGSPTMLWHEKVGPVLAASQWKFFYTEPTNQQDVRHEIDLELPTALSRLESLDGQFCNVPDWKVMVAGDLREGVFTYKAEGRLTDEKGKQSSPYKLAYTLDKAGYEVKAWSAAPAHYFFPIVAGNDTTITIEGNKATVKYPQATFVVTASKPIQLKKTPRGDRTFVIIAGLMTEQLYVDVDAGETVDVTIKEQK